MKKRDILIISAIILMLVAVSNAVTFTPQGDINLREWYNIQNIANVTDTLGDIDFYTNISIQSGYYYEGDGAYLTNTSSCVTVSGSSRGDYSSLSAALSNHAENACITVKRGSYTESSSISVSPKNLTVYAYGARFNLATATWLDITNATDFNWFGGEFSGSSADSVFLFSGGTNDRVEIEGVYIHDMEISSDNYGIKTWIASYDDSELNDFTLRDITCKNVFGCIGGELRSTCQNAVMDNWLMERLTIDNVAYGVNFGSGNATHNITRMKIQNFDIYNVTRSDSSTANGIRFTTGTNPLTWDTGEDLEISHGTVEWVHNSTGNLANHEAIYSKMNRTSVHDVTIIDGGWFGIGIKDGSANQTDCSVHDNKILYFTQSGMRCGINFICRERCSAYNNLIYGVKGLSYSTGICLEGPMNYSKFHGNTILDSTYGIGEPPVAGTWTPYGPIQFYDNDIFNTTNRYNITAITNYTLVNTDGNTMNLENLGLTSDGTITGVTLTDGTGTITGGDLTGWDDINSTEFYQNGNLVLDTTDESGLDVNSSDYWDSLGDPSDISTGDLTDDNTYVTVAGDSMGGTLAFGNYPFTITSASQIANLNASYAGVAYDLTCSGSCVSDSEVDNDITASNYLLLAGGTMSGNVDMGDNNITNMDFVNATRGQFDYVDKEEISAPATPPSNILRLYVEDIQGFSFYKYVDSTGMRRQLARDSVMLVKNVRGTTIAAGRLVYATGSADNVPTVDGAQADSISTMPAIGVTLESIANGSFGRVMQVGLLENINTDSFTEGDILYVSATTAGGPTNTAPATPNFTQEIGTVLVKSATVGAIQIVARALDGNEYGTVNDFTIQGNLSALGSSHSFSGNLDMNSYNITEIDKLNMSGDLECSSCINPEDVNDIDKEDIEGDVNTFVDIDGDTMAGLLNFSTYIFAIQNSTQISNLNASYAGIAYDLSCTDCISGTEIDETSLTANYSSLSNSSAYWDALNTPADINAADITDDNTYLTVAGDTLGGVLNFGNYLFTITNATQVTNLNASYAGISYDVSCASSCVSDAEVDDTITASNYLLLAGGTMTGDINLGSNQLTNADGLTDSTGNFTGLNATANDLQLFLALEENSGSTVYDSSADSTNNYGTMRNMDASDWVQGRYGHALVLDGVNDYFNVSDAANLEISDGTVSFWFKPTTDYNVTQQKTFIDKGNTYFGFGYAATAPAGLYFTLYDGSGHNVRIARTANFSAGLWYHAALTWGAGGQKIYIDGVLDNSGAHTGGFSDVANEWQFGENSAPRWPFNGAMDEIRFYSHQFSDEEVRTLYLLGRPDVDASGHLFSKTGGTMTGTLDMNTNILTNVGNAGTDFDTSGGVTFAGNVTIAAASLLMLTPTDAPPACDTEGSIYADDSLEMPCYCLSNSSWVQFNDFSTVCT
jgi:hypothetical protein